MRAANVFTVPRRHSTGPASLGRMHFNGAHLRLIRFTRIITA